MGIRTLASGAIALGALFALQTGTAGATAVHRGLPALSADTIPTVTRTTSKGEVSSDPNVTPAMLEAQKDPNHIGTPAWWRTHATADGQPLSAAGARSK